MMSHRRILPVFASVLTEQHMIALHAGYTICFPDVRHVESSLFPGIAVRHLLSLPCVDVIPSPPQKALW